MAGDYWNVSAGALDRRVKLLVGSVSRDATHGGEQITYAELATVWAQVMENAGAQVSASGNAALAAHAWPHRIRIRWRAGVVTPLRVQLDDGRIVQIEGIANEGRKQFLLLAGMEWGHQQP